MYLNLCIPVRPDYPYDQDMNTSVAVENFTAWSDALATRDPLRVAALYMSGFTLQPTLSQQIITDHDGAVAYFTMFCARNPDVEMIEEHKADLNDDVFMHTGIYRFTLGPDDNRETMDARFSLIWKKTEAGWRILHHHSSRVPEV